MSKTIEEKDRDKFLALSILAESDGGKVVIKTSLTDITNSIEQLASAYKEASHIELIRLCADLNSRLSLYRALTRAEKKLKQVEEIIAEALTDE